MHGHALQSDIPIAGEGAVDGILVHGKDALAQINAGLIGDGPIGEELIALHRYAPHDKDPAAQQQRQDHRRHQGQDEGRRPVFSLLVKPSRRHSYAYSLSHRPEKPDPVSS